MLSDGGFISYHTSGGERMRITSGGNVGIGTTAPISLLDVCVLSSGARRLLVNYDDSLVTIKSASSGGGGENLRLIGDNIIFNSGSSGSGTERMRITSGGNVLIGTTTFAGANPVLEVSTQAEREGISIKCVTNGYSPLAIRGASNQNFFFVNEIGNISIGTGKVFIGTISDNGHKLQVSGSISATSFFETSDSRLKNITKKYDSEEFGAIEFGWIDGRDSKNHWGYVAQEVQKYLPDAIHLGNDGLLAVDYNQAHTFKIAKVEDEVTLLKKRVAELESQLNSL
jgi:hypothetical protein